MSRLSSTLALCALSVGLLGAGHAHAQPFAILFKDTNYRGSTVLVNGDIRNLKDFRFNDAASAIRVTGGQPLALYKDTEFRGRCLTVSGDIAHLGKTALGNDQLSSVRVAWTCEGGPFEVDACVAHPCGPNQVCKDHPRPAPNSPAGRTCQCAPGMVGSPAQGCTPAEVDACASSPCGAQATCLDLPGPEAGPAGRTCACPTGLTGDPSVACTAPVDPPPTTPNLQRRVLHVALAFDADAKKALGPDPRMALAAAAMAAHDMLASATQAPLVVELELAALIDWSLGLPSAVTLSPDDRGRHLLEPALSGLSTFFGQHTNALSQLAGAPVDALILLSGKELWSRPVQQTEPVLTLGTSYVDGMCTRTAVGVLSLARGSAVLDRLLARNLAFMIGARTLPHSDPSLMGMASTDTFGEISQREITTWFATRYGVNQPRCLDDQPVTALAARCGDGQVQPGEQCDPGLGLADSCCASCALVAGCACANTEPCCSDGQIAPAGQSCRASSGECDLADTCDGLSAACDDVIKAQGSGCALDGMCFDGECVSGTAQVRKASPDLFAASHCPSAPPLERRCTQLAFRSSPQTSCSSFLQLTPLDGTPCGEGLQCMASQCVATSSLKRFSWTTGPWSSCVANQQTRAVSCVDEARAPAGDAMCSGARPLASQSCSSAPPPSAPTGPLPGEPPLPRKGELSVKLKTETSWPGGYCMRVEIGNKSKAALLWKVELPITGTIYSAWGATRSGDSQTVRFWGLAENASLAPKAKTEFGFCANR